MPASLINILRSLGVLVFLALAGLLAVAAIVISFQADTPWPAAIVLPIALAILVFVGLAVTRRVRYGPAEPLLSGMSLQAQTFAAALFWMVATAVVLTFVTWGLLAVAPPLGVLTPFAAIVLLLSLSRAAKVIRDRRADAVLSYLDQAVRANLPIPTVLEAARRSEDGLLSARLGDLNRRLSDGDTLGDALADTVPEVPARAVQMITVGERLGQLPQALRWLNRPRIESELNEPPEEIALYGGYPAFLAVTLLLIVSLYMVFVIPKFEQIFKDFHTDLPSVTQDLLIIARSPLPQILAVGAALFVLAQLGRHLARLIRPIPGGRLPGATITDEIIWVTPIFGSAAHDRGMADVCAAVADGLDGGRPLHAVLAEASLLDVNRVLQGRVREWAAAAAAGAPPADAARAAAMPALLVGMLQSARGPEDTSQALRFLAGYYASRYRKVAVILRGLWIPFVVVTFGVIVGWVALSLFAPLSSLIQAVQVHRPSL
jgi:type IV pilus assembly protein PilC